MKTDRWTRVNEIFHAALERPTGERCAFVSEACAGDQSLRGEIDKLLAADAADDQAFDQITSDLITSWAAEDEGNALIGQTFGRYRILGSLGSGGMGTVYAAEDTTLKRKVALKLLPRHFTRDADRLRRFEQEARAASALNHPHIITIHEFGVSDGDQFIATEFIEGETLSELMRRAPLPSAEVIDIGIQASGALAAAHEAGIVHRDIKPANIMLRRDGYVKVLDFGLAKLTSARANVDVTQLNKVMGTINYMSPEQAMGQPLDARTDVFSLGVVLHELATGQRLFEGKSEAAIYDAILHKPPRSVHDFVPTSPPDLDHVLRRALAKDPAQRYQSATELRADLKRLAENNGGTEAGRIARRSTAKKIVAAATAAAVLLGAIVFFALLGKAPTSSVARNFSFTQLTGGGDASYPSLSPDGKTVIFSSRADGRWQIYRQLAGSDVAVSLTKDSTSDDYQAVFSPDGSHVAFRSEREGGGIFVMSARGESVRRISESGYNPAWSPDGKEIAFSTSQFENPAEIALLAASLFVADVNSGGKRQIKTGCNVLQPSWSPDGGRIAFWESSGGKRYIKTVSAKDEGEATVVMEDGFVNWNPVWSPNGRYIYFASDRNGSMNFWRIAVDEKTGAPLGKIEPFTLPSAHSSQLAFARGGKRIAFAQTIISANIVSQDFDPETETVSKNLVALTHGSARFNRNPAVSPDGQWIAFDAVKDNREHLFVMKHDGTGVRQLTNESHRNRGPNWSPDGKRLLFYSDRTGRYECWTINPDGTGLKQITFDGKASAGWSLWSPDGKRILQNANGVPPRIFSVDKPVAEQTPMILPRAFNNGDDFRAISWSRDGDKLAGYRDSTSPQRIGVLYYSLGTRQFTNVADYGESPVWLSDSRRMIFFDVNKVFLHDITTRQTKQIMSFAPNENIQLLDVAPNDREIYYALRRRESNIWLGTAE